SVDKVRNKREARWTSLCMVRLELNVNRMGVLTRQSNPNRISAPRLRRGKLSSNCRRDAMYLYSKAVAVLRLGTLGKRRANRSPKKYSQLTKLISSMMFWHPN